MSVKILFPRFIPMKNASESRTGGVGYLSVGDLERACAKLLAPLLEPGQLLVGVRLDGWKNKARIRHP